MEQLDRSWCCGSGKGHGLTRRTRIRSAFFAWMVRGFEICADLLECEPCWFEFAARVESGLVHVMTALRITAGAEGMDREGANFWRKLDDADIGSTGNTIAAFLSALGRGVEREHSAIVTIHAANSETGLRILKVFVLAFVDTLQTRKFAPRDFPRSEITLQ